MEHGIRQATEDSESEGEDEDDNAGEPLQVPLTQTPTLITLEQLRSEQANCAECQKILKDLEAAQDWPKTVGWAIYEEVLCRKTVGRSDGHDSLRPYVPEKLRNAVMRNFHCSIWGVHRGEKSTFREIASRYFWPGMYEQVRDFVSKCDVCQLGKGELCDEEPSVPIQCTAQYNRKTTQDRCSRSHPRHRVVEGGAKGKDKSTEAMRRLLTILTSELVSKTENPSRGRA